MTILVPPPGFTFRVIYGQAHSNITTYGHSPLACTGFRYLDPELFFHQYVLRAISYLISHLRPTINICIGVLRYNSNQLKKLPTETQ